MSIRRFAMTAVLFATVSALPVPAFAQQVGIKGGVNFASLTDADAEFPNNSQRIGLVGGGWLRTPERNRFSFQVEALFTEKGMRIEEQEQGFTVEGDIRLRYVEVPLLGRVDLGTPGSPTRLYLMGGAAPAFNIGARLKAEAGGEEETMDLDDEIDSFDVGLVAAAGVEFGRALVEARYTHGLKSIGSGDGDGDDSPKNRVFSVMVGFRLR